MAQTYGKPMELIALQKLNPITLSIFTSNFLDFLGKTKLEH